ncbi:serine/threonine-protein kinase [Nocardia neocaledoniensis]|nr:serine/threonine-protein kinase [Nocardia neocaledoniensis]
MGGPVERSTSGADVAGSTDPGSAESWRSALDFTLGSSLLGEFESGPATARSGRSRPSGRRICDGLVAMPAVTPVDPRSVVLDNPEVPERKRFCWKCHLPVGRGTANGPGSVVGRCERCQSPFNFRPALEAGEIVADQYEVQGCLARGGLGWLYLAIDRNVSDRWVVLKGLRNPLDFEAHVVALAERQFLSEVAFPGIVKIYNFVKRRSVGDVQDGYIVMEYVAGRSLKKMLDDLAPHRLPIPDAIAYVMEILPALDYLHSFGLAYNDLKPDNIMVSEDEVKLIDLGAVAAMDSFGGIYGTPGFQAPEITETGPSVASDIFTVGRTLADLVMLPRVGGNPGELPDLDDIPELQEHPALYRVLRRATDPDPARRFPSAYSMHSQLAGVLRMTLSIASGDEHPHASVEFGAMRGPFGIEELIGRTDGIVDGEHRQLAFRASNVVASLPVPLISVGDPSAELLASLAHIEASHALDELRRAADRIIAGAVAEPATFELEGTLTAVRAYLDLGDVAAARDRLTDLRHRFVADWRVSWYSAVAGLLDGRWGEAHENFDLVHGMLPGELAPLMALAATAEFALAEPGGGESDTVRWRQLATECYGTVWRTNHGVVSAAFGLARQLAANGKALEAVSVLDEVPVASRHHSIAHMTGCLLLVSRPVAEITEADLEEAGRRLRAVPDDPRALQMRVVIVGAALEWVRAGGCPAAGNAELLGYPATERGLQVGLEASLRSLARAAPTRQHRYRLIDLANYVRPRTLF